MEAKNLAAELEFWSAEGTKELNEMKNTTDSWNQLPELSLTLLRGGW